ncbi:MAG: diaminopimelate epimerase [Calditrichaceae bacterium]
MSKQFNFKKIEATGNDFVFIDIIKNKIREISAEEIRQICDRHKGIGADGIVLVSYAKDNPPTMKYYNADGSLGEMCGNALRATVLFCSQLNKIKVKTWQKLIADDGQHAVYMDSADEIQVEIKVKHPLENVSDADIGLKGNFQMLGFINTGVPHLVLNAETDLKNIDVVGLGRQLRYHKQFQPEGTNVNFLKIIDKNKLQIRTYERGVENETLSCGTGVIASTIAYWAKPGNEYSDVSIFTLGGELEVFYKNDKLFLKGPARVAFVGQYLYV